MSGATDEFRNFNSEDREAFKTLREETRQKLDRAVSIGDFVKAVTPGLETPEYLQDI